MLDTLSRLANTNNESGELYNKDKLNTLFITLFIKIELELKDRMVKGYITDL